MVMWRQCLLSLPKHYFGDGSKHATPGTSTTAKLVQSRTPWINHRYPWSIAWGSSQDYQDPLDNNWLDLSEAVVTGASGAHSQYSIVLAAAQ